MNNNEQIKETFVSKSAGLVLLHPFFKRLFTNLELLDKNNTITNKSLAARTLHFAATGNSYVTESSMMLEKYICDIPITSNISDDFVLSDSIKKEVDEMLSTVIGHWTVLKNTSIEGLRNCFLQRQGNINHTKYGDEIKIERKSIDILLDKLPWSYGRITFPWKKNHLVVYW